MSMYHVLVCCPQRQEKGIGLSGPGLIDGSEPPTWVLGIKPSHLKEQPVVLAARPSL